MGVQNFQWTSLHQENQLDNVYAARKLAHLIPRGSWVVAQSLLLLQGGWVVGNDINDLLNRNTSKKKVRKGGAGEVNGRELYNPKTSSRWNSTTKVIMMSVDSTVHCVSFYHAMDFYHARVQHPSQLYDRW